MASGQMENHNYDITCARFSGLCLSLFRLKKDTKMTPILLLREDSLAEGDDQETEEEAERRLAGRVTF